MQIRNMSPAVTPAFTASERRYRLAVVGPDGATLAASGTSCIGTGAASPETVRFLGNGTYTVQIQTSADANDFSCAKLGPVQSFQFAIAASTSVTPPAARLLTRRPGQFDLIPYTFGVGVNPGADDVEVRYARRATLAPDGGIAGDPSRAFVDEAAGTARLTFSEPGTYTFVSRAVEFGTNASTPWSAPVTVQVLAPFDFVGRPYFTDSRGPSYRIKATVREKSARGRVTVAIAKGRKGGKFRRIGRVRIKADGTFAVRFTQRGRGVYRFRYSFAGSRTVAGGYVVQRARIRRVAF